MKQLLLIIISETLPSSRPHSSRQVISIIQDPECQSSAGFPEASNPAGEAGLDGTSEKDKQHDSNSCALSLGQSSAVILVVEV